MTEFEMPTDHPNCRCTVAPINVAATDADVLAALDFEPRCSCIHHGQSNSVCCTNPAAPASLVVMSFHAGVPLHCHLPEIQIVCAEHVENLHAFVGLSVCRYGHTTTNLREWLTVIGVL